MTAQNCLRFLGHMDSWIYVVQNARLSQEAAELAELSVLPNAPSTGYAGSGTHRSLRLFELMDGPIQCMCESSFCFPTANSDSGYRCFCPGLGSPSGNSGDSRSLIWPGFSFPYKRKWVKSHSSSWSWFFLLHQGKEFTSSYRQCSGDVLCEQTGRGQIITSVPRSNTDLGVLYCHLNLPQSLPASGCPQQSGRPAEEIIPQ